MSWEPDTEENRLGRVRKELEDLKASTSFLNTPINDGTSSNALGVGFGVSSFNQGANGDIPQQIVNNVQQYGSSWWGFVESVASFMVITPSSQNEPFPNQSTIKKINGGVDGQKTVLKPATGTTIRLLDNPNTNLSTEGDLLIGSDLVLTDTESVTLRFTTDVLYSDSYENNDPTKTEIQKIGGWIIESTSSGSGNSTNGILKDPVKVSSTGNNSLHPVWGATIDGIGMVAGDRFLVKDQTTQADNGIYIWAVLGSTRSSDMSHGSVQKEGTMTYTQDGNTQAEILYAINIGGNNITIGTSANTWGEIGSGSGGGGSGTIKSPCKYATTANITLSGEQSIDGTATSTSRVLVKNQTTASQNGIYVTATGAWARSTDMATASTIEGGTMVYVTDGTVNGDNLFGLTTEGTVIVGTTNQAWANLTVGGANKTLSNLTSPTAVNQHLLPDGDEVEDLGHTSNVWRRLYAKDIYSTGTIRTEATDDELEFYTGGGKRFGISVSASAPFNGVAELFGVNSAYKTMANSTGVNNAEIGDLAFDGYDSAVNRHTYASIIGVSENVSSGAEDGLLKFNVVRGSATQQMFEVNTMGIRLPTSMIQTPTANGSIYLDGTDIKVRTGGSTVDLSNIGTNILPLSNIFTGSVNTFSNASGTFSASTPTVNLGTGAGTINVLGRLQMSGMPIYWNGGLTYSVTGGSSAGGFDFQIPSTAGHGFDFQLGTGVSGVPQFGITNTSVESNVNFNMNNMIITWDTAGTYKIHGGTGAGGMDFNIPSSANHGFDFKVGTGVGGLPQAGITNTEVGLNVALDMNLNPIKFQAITGVATPSGLEKRFLFSDSANSDELSVKLPSGSIVSLEGGGTNLIPLSNTFTGSVNTFYNATGTFQATTPIINLGTGAGTINALGRLQMTGNPIYWNSGLTYSVTGGSSAGGMDFQIPSTAGHGFDFQLGTGVSGNPQMGIANDEVGLNVPLDMNLNYIKFQAISSPSAPTGLEKRFLFSDSSNSDHLSVRTTSGVVDLESGGTNLIPLNNVFTGINQFTNASTFNALSANINLGSSANSALITVLGRLVLYNINTAPTVTGQFTRDGADVKVYTGGVVKNLTDIGTGSGASLSGNNIFTGINQFTNTSTFNALASSVNFGAGSTSNTGVLISVNGQLGLANLAIDPNVTGRFTRNGNDVKVYTGGGVKNLSDIGTGGGGADQDLNNLTTTSINQHLIPLSDDTYDLGASNKQWRKLYIDGTAYIDTLSLTGGSSGDVLSTNGSGTLSWVAQSGGASLTGNNFFTGAFNQFFHNSGTFNVLMPYVNLGGNGVVSIIGELKISGALNHDGSTVGFYGKTPISKQTVSTSASNYTIVTALKNLGLFN